jgi:hypothetical protein
MTDVAPKAERKQMKLTKTRSRAGTGEALVTFWQGGQGGDLDAVQVFEDGLLIHTSTQRGKEDRGEEAS